jgi:GWxTD domain-containing protein
MRRSTSVLIMVSVLGLSSLTAQTLTPRDPLKVGLDLVRFRGGDDEHTFVEVQYAFSERSITYKKETSGFDGAMDLTVLAILNDSIQYADRWLVPHTIADTSLLTRDMNLVGVYGFQLRDGDYTIRVIGRDRHDPLRRDSLTLRVPLRGYKPVKPMLSDIELAASIRPGKKGGLFYKNTLDVVPNVTSTYTEDQLVYYYAEAYNLNIANDTSEYTVRTKVYDAVGKEIMSRERAKKRVAESSVLIDQFPVNSIRTGSYTLAMALLDTGHQVMNTQARRFFVINQLLGIDSSLLVSSTTVPMAQYMSMDEAELDREFDWTRFEAMDSEKDQYAKLGKMKDKGTEAEAKARLEAKRKYISDFWRKRPLGVREEYLARVAYANANFRQMSREGYRTDRGRVHIMYGMPDDFERHPNETETRPYEIWNYNNIQGGVYFVFVQRNTAGDYELVHSTHRNELHDENWNRQGITR